MQTLCATDTSEATMVGWLLMSRMPRLSAGYSKCGQRGKALVRYLTGSMIGISTHPHQQAAQEREIYRRCASSEDICKECADG